MSEDERLTERDEYGNADIVGVDSADLQENLEFKALNRVTFALNRLAAYEDVGSPEEFASLRAQLAESRAREQAAIADMKRIVDTVREEREDETCCFACKYDADMSITDSGAHANECPGFNKNDCFEWRGPQDAKGEAR